MKPSKLYVLATAPPRAKDMDDLQSIFSVDHELDAPYLTEQMRKLKIAIPSIAEPFLPASLLRLCPARGTCRTGKKEKFHGKG